MVLTFSVLDQKPFFRQTWSKKKQNRQFKWKFGTKANLNFRNSMMMFSFSVFDHEYLPWANLVQKFKIVQSEI